MSLTRRAPSWSSSTVQRHQVLAHLQVAAEGTSGLQESLESQHKICSQPRKSTAQLTLETGVTLEFLLRLEDATRSTANARATGVKGLWLNDAEERYERSLLPVHPRSIWRGQRLQPFSYPIPLPREGTPWLRRAGGGARHSPDSCVPAITLVAAIRFFFFLFLCESQGFRLAEFCTLQRSRKLRNKVRMTQYRCVFYDVWHPRPFPASDWVTERAMPRPMGQSTPCTIVTSQTVRFLTRSSKTLEVSNATMPC